MSIRFQILGQPGRDNCVFVTVDSGQRITTLLFDCGAGCLETLSISDVMSIDHLCFSHLHMDHVCGFDHFFRINFARDEKPNWIYGPPGTARIIQHRMQGFLWNLNTMDAAWHLLDIDQGFRAETRLELSESFSTAHPGRQESVSGLEPFIDDVDFQVRAIRLEHHGPCLGFRIDEKPKINIDPAKLSELGLRPGPWLQTLKSDVTGQVEIDGQSLQLEQLRADLLIHSTGDSLAYLTDFLLDEVWHNMLVQWLAGCQQVICESQYCHADLELAVQNHHTTTQQVARLARDAGVEQLYLFHLSDRYDCAGWLSQLTEARAIFLPSAFPETWDIS